MNIFVSEIILKAKMSHINSSVPLLQKSCPWVVIVDHEPIIIILKWLQLFLKYIPPKRITKFKRVPKGGARLSVK